MKNILEILSIKDDKEFAQKVLELSQNVAKEASSNKVSNYDVLTKMFGDKELVEELQQQIKDYQEGKERTLYKKDNLLKQQLGAFSKTLDDEKALENTIKNKTDKDIKVTSYNKQKRKIRWDRLILTTLAGTALFGSLFVGCSKINKDNKKVEPIVENIDGTKQNNPMMNDQDIIQTAADILNQTRPFGVNATGEQMFKYISILNLELALKDPNYVKTHMMKENAEELLGLVISLGDQITEENFGLSSVTGQLLTAYIQQTKNADIMNSKGLFQFSMLFKDEKDTAYIRKVQSYIDEAVYNKDNTELVNKNLQELENILKTSSEDQTISRLARYMSLSLGGHLPYVLPNNIDTKNIVKFCDDKKNEQDVVNHKGLMIEIRNLFGHLKELQKSIIAENNGAVIYMNYEDQVMSLVTSKYVSIQELIEKNTKTPSIMQNTKFQEGYVDGGTKTETRTWEEVTVTQEVNKVVTPNQEGLAKKAEIEKENAQKIADTQTAPKYTGEGFKIELNPETSEINITDETGKDVTAETIIAENNDKKIYEDKNNNNKIEASEVVSDNIAEQMNKDQEEIKKAQEDAAKLKAQMESEGFNQVESIPASQPIVTSVEDASAILNNVTGPNAAAANEQPVAENNTLTP